jgi:hypothetical protein
MHLDSLLGLGVGEASSWLILIKFKLVSNLDIVRLRLGILEES